jgi:hypothetical protein
MTYSSKLVRFRGAAKLVDHSSLSNKACEPEQSCIYKLVNQWKGYSKACGLEQYVSAIKPETKADIFLTAFYPVKEVQLSLLSRTVCLPD